MKKVKIELSNDEAMVLLDWLAKFNENKNIMISDVEKRVLFDLESNLEANIKLTLTNNKKL